MRSVKDFNEQEKIYYYKCKSRVLDIILCEAIVGVIAWNFVSDSDVLRQTGLFLMIVIPVIFFHMKMLKISPPDREEIFASAILTIFWCILFIQRRGVLIGGILAVMWVLILFDILTMYNSKRKNN